MRLYGLTAAPSHGLLHCLTGALWPLVCCCAAHSHYNYRGSGNEQYKWLKIVDDPSEDTGPPLSNMRIRAVRGPACQSVSGLEGVSFAVLRLLAGQAKQGAALQ